MALVSLIMQAPLSLLPHLPLLGLTIIRCIDPSDPILRRGI